MAMVELPDIPDFLKVANRVPLPKDHVARKPPRARREKRSNWRLPKNIEPAGLQLLREIEAKKKAAQAVRLAALRDRRRLR